MIYATTTVPVNPNGEVPLTRPQVWVGLVLKGRDAREFLPSGLCTRCDVVEESATHLVHEATIAGDDLREIITLERRGKVTFFQASGPSGDDARGYSDHVQAVARLVGAGRVVP